MCQKNSITYFEVLVWIRMLFQVLGVLLVLVFFEQQNILLRETQTFVQSTQSSLKLLLVERLTDLL